MEVQDLQEKTSRQSVLGAEEWNAVVRFLQGEGLTISRAGGSATSSDARSLGDEPNVRTAEHYVVAVTGDDLEPYSVFGIVSGASANGPTTFAVSKIGPSSPGNPSLVYTNGPVGVTAVIGKVMARPIGYFSPAKVRVATGQDEPRVGYPCGVYPGTYGVADGQYGMICLGLDEVDGETLAVVMRAFEHASMMGIVTQEMTSANYGAMALGQGRVKLVYADPGTGDLMDALPPTAEGGSGSGSGDEEFDLASWNAAERTIEVDEPVGLSITLGVGLVATPLRCAEGSGS